MKIRSIEKRKHMSPKVSNLRDGILAAFPICIGYVPIAIAFGLLAKAIHISLLHTFLFSVLVFAGASQFVALNLIQNGIGMGEIILATLLLNFRHFLMSASLASRMPKKKPWVWLAAFGVTDETFSIACTREGAMDTAYLIGLNTTSYIGWIMGSVIGYMAGDLLPTIIQRGMGISLYAMFVAILIPTVKKSIRFGIIAVLAGSVHMILNRIQLLGTGWNIVLAIVIGAGIATLIFPSVEEGSL